MALSLSQTTTEPSVNEEEEGDEESSLGKVTAQMCIGVIIFCQNLLVLLTVIKCRELHTTKYIFTASLAVADTFIGALTIFALPLNLSIIIERKGKETFITTFFVTLCMGAHLLSLVQMMVVAIERYLYVAHPFFYLRNMTSGAAIRYIVAGVWLFFLLFNALLVVLQAFVVGEYVTVIRGVNTYILKTCTLGTYVTITAVTCACYVLILCQVRKMRTSVNVLQVVTAAKVKRAPKWRDHLKSLRFFLLTFGFYFFMTSPAMIEECLPELFRDSVSVGVRSALIFSLILNSGVNFFILNAVDSEFRTAMRKNLGGPLTRLASSYCGGGGGGDSGGGDFVQPSKSTVKRIHVVSI